MPLPLDYQFDPTAVNVDNAVSAEVHTVSSATASMIALEHGTFFTEGLVIVNNITFDPLVLNTDYYFRGFDPEITALTGHECASAIYFPAFNGDVAVDYQVVGGYQGRNSAIAKELSDAISTLTGSVFNFTTIGDKPETVTPDPHDHDLLADLTNLERLRITMDDIKEAIINKRSLLKSNQNLSERVERLLYIIAGMRIDINGIIDGVVLPFATPAETLAGTVADEGVSPATLAFQQRRGYDVPIPYAAGIDFGALETTKTILKDGIVYAVYPDELPLVTSGFWNYTAYDYLRFNEHDAEGTFSNGGLSFTTDNIPGFEEVVTANGLSWEIIAPPTLGPVSTPADPTTLVLNNCESLPLINLVDGTNTMWTSAGSTPPAVSVGGGLYGTNAITLDPGDAVSTTTFLHSSIAAGFPDLNALSAWTIELAYYPTLGSSSRDGLFSYGLGTPGDTSRMRGINIARVDDSFRIALSHDGNVVLINANVNVDIPLNTWHRVELTYTGTGYILFFNGIPIWTFANATKVVAGTAVRLGHAYAGATGTDLEGRIDEFRVSNRSLHSNGASYSPATAPFIVENQVGSATISEPYPAIRFSYTDILLINKFDEVVYLGLSSKNNPTNYMQLSFTPIGVGTTCTVEASISKNGVVSTHGSAVIDMTKLFGDVFITLDTNGSAFGGTKLGLGSITAGVTSRLFTSTEMTGVYPLNLDTFYSKTEMDNLTIDLYGGVITSKFLTASIPNELSGPKTGYVYSTFQIILSLIEKDKFYPALIKASEVAFIGENTKLVSENTEDAIVELAIALLGAGGDVITYQRGIYLGIDDTLQTVSYTGKDYIADANLLPLVTSGSWLGGDTDFPRFFEVAGEGELIDFNTILNTDATVTEVKATGEALLTENNLLPVIPAPVVGGETTLLLSHFDLGGNNVLRDEVSGSNTFWVKAATVAKVGSSLSITPYTVTPKFGAACLALNNGGKLTHAITPGSELDLSAKSEWVIDGWVNFNDRDEYGGVISILNNAGYGISVGLDNERLYARISTNGTSWNIPTIATGDSNNVIRDRRWHHWTLGYDGSKFRITADGYATGVTANIPNITLPTVATVGYGAGSTASNFYMFGYQDELRISDVYTDYRSIANGGVGVPTAPSNVINAGGNIVEPYSVFRFSMGNTFDIELPALGKYIDIGFENSSSLDGIYLRFTRNVDEVNLSVEAFTSAGGAAGVSFGTPDATLSLDLEMLKGDCFLMFDRFGQVGTAAFMKFGTALNGVVTEQYITSLIADPVILGLDRFFVRTSQANLVFDVWSGVISPSTFPVSIYEPLTSGPNVYSYVPIVLVLAADKPKFNPVGLDASKVVFDNTGLDLVGEDLYEVIVELNSKINVYSGARVSSVRVRQTMLAGPTNVNALPTILSTTGATTMPLIPAGANRATAVVCFSAGFDQDGEVNYVVELDANVIWTVGQDGVVASSSTNFLYINYDPETGAVTTGASALRPVYSFVKPGSPSDGQYWYPTDHRSMGEVWDDTAGVWIPTVRLYVGRAATGVSNFSVGVGYAYQGFTYAEHTFGGPGPGGTGSTAIAANMGTIKYKTEIRGRMVAAAGGFAAGDVFEVKYLNHNGNATTTDEGLITTMQNAGNGESVTISLGNMATANFLMQDRTGGYLEVALSNIVFEIQVWRGF